MNQPSAQLPAVRQPHADLMQPITDLDEALRLSDALSKSELVPRTLQGRPSNIFHVIMTGQQLNLHWTEAIRVIYSPGPGQIGMRGSFLLAQLRRAKHTYSDHYSEDGTACTFTLVRGDTKEKFQATFSVDDAVNAGLAKRKDDGTLVALSREGKPLPWQNWSRRMLRWRAVSECVGFGAPEVMLGFEIEGAADSEPPQPEVVLQPQTPPAQPDAARSREPAKVMLDEAAPEVKDGGIHPDRAISQQLRDLDEHARAQVTGNVGGSPYGEEVPAEDPTAPDWSGPPAAGQELESQPSPSATESPAKPEAVPGPAGQAAERVLAEAFTAMGWDPKKHRADILRACSTFFRRGVTGVRQLANDEKMRLATRLAHLQQQAPEAAWPVALADAVAGWVDEWERDDPEGYAKYTGAS